MSKQFYKYLSDKLIKYLSNDSINPGERFYIQFDEQNQVDDFYNVLKENEGVEKFVYKHDKGGEYETFSIKLDNIKLVVAATIGVTPGYMVTIRNASQEQSGPWENTSLLILCSEPLDSIKGGCRDLKKEGMPLNVRVISSGLNDEIEKSKLTKAEKEIIRFHISNKLLDTYNTSLWDYSEILSTIKRGEMEEEDYHNIGIFKDKDLDNLNSANIRKRLKENNELFSKVEAYEEYEDREQQLEKFFDEKGVQALKKNNWRDVTFAEVKQSYENNKKDKALGYIEDSNRKFPSGVGYWERAKSETSSGRRKRFIIVFNNGILDQVELKFTFDDYVSNQFIHPNSKKYMIASGKSLNAKLPADRNESLFYRLVYNHNNQPKSKYEFNIAVININEKYLETVKTRYEIKTGSGGKNRIFLNNDGSDLLFGQGDNFVDINIEEENQLVEIKENEVFRIFDDSSSFDDDSVRFRLSYNGAVVPIEVRDEFIKGTPINAVRIAKLKREKNESFTWSENKLKQDTSEFFLEDKLKKTLIMEKHIVEQGILYGEIGLNYEIEPISVIYSQELTNAYISLIDYFRSIDNLPSLTALNYELITLYSEYLEAYNKEIEAIEERQKLSNLEEKKNLLKLGTIKGQGKIWMSPLAPINVAYTLELWRQLGNEVIETHLLERLIPNNLVPYIYNDDNKLYRPIYQRDNVEWLIYEESNSVSLGETSAFVAKVIKEKIEQFISHFSYIFSKKSSAPLKINIINVKNDKEVVIGIFEYIKDQILKDHNNIIPVELMIYNEGEPSEFDAFFSLASIEKLEEYFDISFKIRNNELDPMDILKLTLDNIKYFKCKGTDYSYAHISFYKSSDDDRPAQDNTSTMISGLSLGGLLSTVTSNNNGDDYRIGFGTKNSIPVDNQLIRTSLNINEFAVNIFDGGINPYRNDTSIVTRPLTIDSNVKDKLYKNSHWVTFIEPNFGLEYFTEDNKEGLIVIHYSDQYSSTEQYDTITVTNKSSQYKYMIQEFLSKKNITISDSSMNEVIKSFNSINGEWLLNLIKNKNEYDREKLSIIAALKYGMSILNHEEIIWIPISLEEILRISSAVKLNKSEGIFSVKNLKQKGIHSDDLIFIGVNIKDKEHLKIYYYPVEVKVGYNFSGVIDKGTIQVNKTYKLLKEQLTQYEEDGRKAFKNKFFRNFFIRLLISNGQKLVVNNIWPQKNLERINELKKYLLNDDYVVSFELESIIGKGALISFKKDNYWRSLHLEDSILYMELTEEDAYKGIAEPIEELKNKICQGRYDIPVSKLLFSHDLVTLINVDNKEIETEIGNQNDYSIEELTPYENDAAADISYSSGASSNIEGQQLEASGSNSLVATVDSAPTKDIEDIKVLLGEAEGSTRKIFWEYGSKDLANRHLLITGKSGNGKTYFIQCAIKDVVEAGVPALIIDYTDGFKASQLEPEFKLALQGKIRTFIVAANKFPLNPFKKGRKELDEGIYIDEDAVDVAERFKGIIGAVYKDLGIQQLNSIYQAIIRGLQRYDGKLNLSAFRSELEEDNSSYAQTALSQLSVLLDKNPFEENKDFQWEELDNSGGKLFIIQLTGFTKDVQRIITEMILWDLWNYKTQHGKKEKPFAVILDEAQNLNFSDNAPSTKILTEGRKFGWSAWFSTQFLKGQMDKATISRLQNSAQKIYFAQTEEEAPTVAANFADNAEDRKNWTKKLINLNKGTCIAYGPIRDSNGKLLSAQPIKIKISSLNDRIR